MTTLKWATGMCEHRRAKPRDDSVVLVATAVERLVSHVKRAPLPSLVPPAISAGMTCVAPDAALAARRVKATLVGGIAVLLWALLALFTTGAAGIPPFQLLAMPFAFAFVVSPAVLAPPGRGATSEERRVGEEGGRKWR